MVHSSCRQTCWGRSNCAIPLTRAPAQRLNLYCVEAIRYVLPIWFSGCISTKGLSRVHIAHLVSRPCPVQFRWNEMRWDQSVLCERSFAGETDIKCYVACLLDYTLMTWHVLVYHPRHTSPRYSVDTARSGLYAIAVSSVSLRITDHPLSSRRLLFRIITCRRYQTWTVSLHL